MTQPRLGLQILDTSMGFPRPSLNVVLDSISFTLRYLTLKGKVTLKVETTFLHHNLAPSILWPYGVTNSIT